MKAASHCLLGMLCFRRFGLWWKHVGWPKKVDCLPGVLPNSGFGAAATHEKTARKVSPDVVGVAASLQYRLPPGATLEMPSKTMNVFEVLKSECVSWNLYERMYTGTLKRHIGKRMISFVDI